MMRLICGVLFFLAIATNLGFAQTPVGSALFAAAQKAPPANLSTNEIAKALSAGLWNTNRTALAISINRSPNPSLIFVFLKQADVRYIVGDVSGVETGNFGKLGISGRSEYDRFETTPLEWLRREDGLFQITMRTRAWKSGQRYTVSEKLVVRKDGTPLYR